MGWYDTNSNDWYKTNARPGASNAQAASKLPNGSRKTRYAAIAACLVLLIIVITYVICGFGVSSVDYNADGRPSDWHAYFDKLYGTEAPSAVSASVNIPLAEERGSLSIKNGAAGADLDFSDIYEKCSPSVVGIKVFSEDDREDYYAWGSGVIASSDGYIITNTHVINNGYSAKVVLSDGSEYEAKLIGFDAASDIAVIKIEATGLKAAEFASSSTLSVGDSVAAIGNPLSPDLRLTMTRGIVSALNREMSYNGTTMSLIQTDASINEGNSGGPLFNSRGQVIGITNMKMISSFGSGVEGLGFAIPSDTVESIVEALIKDGAVYGRLSVGITIGPVSEDIAKYYNIPQGLYVSYVTEGSDAEAKGIKRGDIITRVNGRDAFANSDVADAKEGLKAGDELTFTIWRDGKTTEITVKLMDPADMK